VIVADERKRKTRIGPQAHHHAEPLTSSTRVDPLASAESEHADSTSADAYGLEERQSA